MAKGHLTPLDRFLDKVSMEPNSGCWLWTGCINMWGYGLFWYGGVQQGAHCASYRMFVGPIPEGLELDHLCRVRSCVNPKHLEPVTRSVNLRRGIRAENGAKFQRAKTHCKNGHPYTPENTYWVGKNKTERLCKECSYLNQHRQKGYVTDRRKVHRFPS